MFTFIVLLLIGIAMIPAILLLLSVSCTGVMGSVIMLFPAECIVILLVVLVIIALLRKNKKK